MPQLQPVNKGVFEAFDGHVLGSLTFPKGEFQAVVLSVVPENRAGEYHQQKLVRLAEHTQSWDNKIVELLTIADLATPKLEGLLYKISGTRQAPRDTPIAPGVKPTLGRYIHIRGLYYADTNGELQFPAAIAETRNVLGPHREVILHRNTEPTLAIFYNGHLYKQGEINLWTRRIFDDRLASALSREIIPYSSNNGNGQHNFFAPGRMIGLETRLHP